MPPRLRTGTMLAMSNDAGPVRDDLDSPWKEALSRSMHSRSQRRR